LRVESWEIGNGSGGGEGPRKIRTTWKNRKGESGRLHAEGAEGAEAEAKKEEDFNHEIHQRHERRKERRVGRKEAQIFFGCGGVLVASIGAREREGGRESKI